jgi:hypothetical protein
VQYNSEFQRRFGVLGWESEKQRRAERLSARLAPPTTVVPNEKEDTERES